MYLKETKNLLNEYGLSWLDLNNMQRDNFESACELMYDSVNQSVKLPISKNDLLVDIPFFISIDENMLGYIKTLLYEFKVCNNCCDSSSKFFGKTPIEIFEIEFDTYFRKHANYSCDEELVFNIFYVLASGTRYDSLYWEEICLNKYNVN